MSASQRQTRRSSARSEAEDDDAPPTKKQKVERPTTKGLGRSASSKKVASGTKNGGHAYDSNEDDFTFSRKPKKQQTARALNSRDADSQPLRRVDEDKPAPKPRGRKRYSDNLDSDQNETRAPAPPTARRSKRLSGEDAISADVNDQRLTHETRRGRIEERSPNPPPLKTAKTPQPNEEGTLLIDRKRKSTKIALPFNDTPVIQRNKEMRQTSAENRRRSSSTMRGRRASSLIDNGTSTAVPHNNVAISEFYKHISNDLLEPRRMKQLLTWCGSRALTERPDDQSKTDVNAILAARAIQDELLKDFTNRSDMSDWFSRKEEVRPAVLVKQPNPRNVQNFTKLQELEAEVQRLEQEKAKWDKLLTSLSSTLENELAASKHPQPLDATRLDEGEVALQILLDDEASGTAAKARARLKDVSTALEFKIDTFADGVHRLRMLEEVARESSDTIMAEASSALQNRQQAQGGTKESVGDVLKAFSRATS